MSEKIKSLVKVGHRISLQKLSRWLGVSKITNIPPSILVQGYIRLQCLNAVMLYMQAMNQDEWWELGYNSQTRKKFFNYIYTDDPTEYEKWFVKDVFKTVLIDRVNWLGEAASTIQDMEQYSQAVWQRKWVLTSQSTRQATAANPRAVQPTVQPPPAPRVTDSPRHDYDHQDDVPICWEDDTWEDQPANDHVQAAPPPEPPTTKQQAPNTNIQSVAQLTDLITNSTLHMILIVKRVIQFMGQRHYTFKVTGKYRDVYFQVVPEIQLDLQVNGNHLHMVAAYKNKQNVLVPFTTTTRGYEQWSNDLNSTNPQKVLHNHYLMLIAQHVWEYTDFDISQVDLLDDLEDDKMLYYRFREGRGQALVLMLAIVGGHHIPVLFDAITKDVILSRNGEVVQQDIQQSMKVQCPLIECQNTQGQCVHVATIMSMGGWSTYTHQDFSKLARDLVDKNGIRRMRCHNKKLPPLRIAGNIEDLLYNAKKQQFIIRRQASCETCGNGKVAGHGKHQDGLLYTRDFVCAFKFQAQYVCSSVDCEKHNAIQQYTGNDLGAIRYAYDLDKESRGGVSTFTQSVLLNDMMVQCTTTTTTMVQYWSNIVIDKYGRAYEYQLPIYKQSPVYPILIESYLYHARQRINRNMYDFTQIYLKHQDLSAVFGCKRLERCVHGPSIVIFDGSSYGYPAHYDGVHSKPSDNASGDIVHCIPYDKRCLTFGIRTKQLRLLQRLLKPLYVEKQCQNVSRQCEDQAEYKELILQISRKSNWQQVISALNILYTDMGYATTPSTKHHVGAKRQLVQTAIDTEGQQFAIMRFEWQSTFLGALRRCILMVSCRAAKPMLIRVPVLRAMGLTEISKQEYNRDARWQDPLPVLQTKPYAVQVLKDYNPELHALFTNTDPANAQQCGISSSWISWCILQVCCFYDDIVNQPDVTANKHDMSDSIPLRDRHDICYWADVEPIRYNNVYVVGATQREKLHVDGKDDDGDRACSKHPYYTKALTQGLFLALCGHCGGCLGYEVMHGGESPRMPFQWLVRHREQGPEYVIYDNACNLANYALMREPRFFESTRFVVDNFHIFSHHNCAPCHNANYYGQIQGINTQLVEQFWRSLNLNKSTLAHMNKVNYSVVVKMAVYMVLRSRAARDAFQLRGKVAQDMVPSLILDPQLVDNVPRHNIIHAHEGHSIVPQQSVTQGVTPQVQTQAQDSDGNNLMGVDIDNVVDFGQGEVDIFDGGLKGVTV